MTLAIPQPTNLAELDAIIDRSGAYTLDPTRRRATLLTTLAERAPASLRNVARSGLVRIATAQLDAFPENILFDFDALSSSLIHQAQSDSDPAGTLRDLSDRVARLQSLFGRGTSIRFRYVHDFIYGFDWAKWVRRDPSRSDTGPFAREFLVYSERRGHELLDLIENDDQKYPKLPSGAPRNPFAFSREPDDELRLYRALEAHDLLPVRAFEADPKPEWDRAYHRLRDELAHGLIVEP